jgi:hypothetical protein
VLAFKTDRPFLAAPNHNVSEDRVVLSEACTRLEEQVNVLLNAKSSLNSLDEQKELEVKKAIRESIRPIQPFINQLKRLDPPKARVWARGQVRVRVRVRVRVSLGLA